VETVVRRESVWQAMAGRPGRFLWSPWPWRSLAYLCTTVVVAGCVWVCALPAVLCPPLWLLFGIPVGGVERVRLGFVDGAPARSPHLPAGPGVTGWLRRRLREPTTWRELGYTVSLCSVLLVADLVVLGVLVFCAVLVVAPVAWVIGGTSQVQLQFGTYLMNSAGGAIVVGLLGIGGTLLMGYVIGGLAGGQAAFARWLLTPGAAEQTRRVDELVTSRARLVDAFEAERRRIERDLHDGAQQHLVLLTMSLGLAKLELAGSPGPVAPAATELVAEAHQQARRALTALRELIHNIHPQLLTDLGLAAAIGELAERCPLPVDVAVRVGRLPAAVESTAYFLVSEALTNATRHARATRVTVSAVVEDGTLTVVVTDDGGGGADPDGGTGLRGLADRAAVMAGRLTVTSPPGGPTTVRMELPCHYG
jgi:signal transduction histidine kinase